MRAVTRLSYKLYSKFFDNMYSRIKNPQVVFLIAGTQVKVVVSLGCQVTVLVEPLAECIYKGYN